MQYDVSVFYGTGSGDDFAGGECLNNGGRDHGEGDEDDDNGNGNRGGDGSWSSAAIAWHDIAMACS